MSQRGWVLGATLLCGCVPAAAGVVLGARGGGSSGSGSSGSVVSPLGSAAIYAVYPSTAPRSGGTKLHFQVNPGYIMPRGYEFAGTLQLDGQALEVTGLDGSGFIASMPKTRAGMVTLTYAVPGFKTATTSDLFVAQQFTFKVASTPIPGMQALLAGDLDGDGDADLVVVNALGQSHQVLRSELGVFTFSQALASAGSGRSGLLADLDGDGDRDLLLGYSGRAGERWRNEGQATFTRVQQDLTPSLSSGPSTSDFAAGDLDGDGDLDVVQVANGAMVVWSNAGGALARVRELTPVSGITRSQVLARLADLDQDGDLDIVDGSPAGATRLWRNDAGFAFKEVGLVPGGSAQGLVVQDVDGDGRVDILQAESTNVRWLRNEGGLQFTDRGTVLPSAPGRTSPGAVTPLQSGDLDGDGRRDLVCGGNAWLAEPAAGTYRFGGDHTALIALDGARTITQGPLLAAVGDVDRDGDLDFISTDYDAVIRTFENR